MLKKNQNTLKAIKLSVTETGNCVGIFAAPDWFIELLRTDKVRYGWYVVGKWSDMHDGEKSHIEGKTTLGIFPDYNDALLFFKNKTETGAFIYNTPYAIELEQGVRIKKRTVIIAGCTRSGLTMTMQMLNAGGFPCFGTYPAFEDYEHGKIPWKEVNGMAVKTVDTHTQIPPTQDEEHEYHVILLRRTHTQQVKSIIKFMKYVAQLPVQWGDHFAIGQELSKNLNRIREWSQQQGKFVEVNFEDMINNPEETAKKLSDFVGVKLDIEKMKEVVVPRSTDCYNGFLELTFLNK